MPRQNQATTEDRSPNSPAIVRASFLQYLKSVFPYKTEWEHPVTKQKFDHQLIKQKLADYMKLDPSGYRVLWYIWTTQASRAFIADTMHLSSTTVKRRSDKSVDTVLLMLMFPDLRPECFELYSSC